MTQPIRLSELQLAILRVLWRAGEARIAVVHQELALERDLAFTTVATLLKRLEKRGVVAHRTEGRQYVYRACVSEEEATRSAVSELASRLKTADVSELMNHLLSTREIRAGDLERIKELIAEKEKELAASARKRERKS